MDGSPDRHDSQSDRASRPPPRPPDNPNSPRRTTLDEASAEWSPEPGPGQLVGGAVAGLAALLGTTLLSLFASSDGAARALWLLGALASLVVAGAAVLGMRRLASIRYRLGPQALEVTGAGEPLRVPYGSIVEIAYDPRQRIRAAGYERYWPGFHLSRMPVNGQIWRSVATVPPARRVRLRLRDGTTLAISPQRPILFGHALERRIVETTPARVTRPARQTSSRPAAPAPAPPAWEAAQPPAVPRAGSIRAARPNAYTLFRDLILRGDRVTSDALAAALIGLVVMCTITVWRSDAISTPIAVHWNARGEPQRFVEPDGIWVLEGVWIYLLSAVAVLVVNAALATLAAWRGDRLLARLLVGAVPLVELVLLVALWQASRA